MSDIVHLHLVAAWTPLLGARRYRSMHGGSARAGRLGFGADPKLSCRLRHSRPLERLAPLDLLHQISAHAQDEPAALAHLKIRMIGYA